MNFGKRVDVTMDRIKGSFSFVSKRGHFPLFAPGMFVMFLGLAVLLAPRLFIALIASFFVTIGCLLCFVAWRVIQLKRKWETLRKEFQGKVIIQGVHVQDMQVQGLEVTDADESIDSKKIIYH